MAKTLPPKLGGQPPPPTGATRERGTTSPSLPAVKPPAAQPPPQDSKAQKKSLKDVDWSQKQYFDGDGLQGSEPVAPPPPETPKRGRTLVIPAIREQPQPQAEAEPRGAWAEAERPSSQDTKESQKARAQEGKDAKAASGQHRALGSSAARSTQKLAMQPPPLPGAAPPKGTLYEALQNAKEPGVLFKEDDERSSPGRNAEDPELMEAVEECIRLLFGVRGIHHIGPGEDEQGEPVVVISAAQGFNEESMRRVPESVGRFKTLVALPFDTLPLKRTAR